MKKIIYQIIMFLISCNFYGNISYAQSSALGSWVIPGDYDIHRFDFNQNGISVQNIVNNPYIGTLFANSAAAFSAGGELLFYTMGNKVFNSSNIEVGNYTPQNLNGVLDPEVEIILKPGTLTDYLIFWSAYTSGDSPVGWLYYTEVNYDPYTHTFGFQTPTLIESTGGMTGLRLTEPDEEGNRKLWFVSRQAGLCVVDITDEGVMPYETILESNDAFFENPNNFLAYDVEVFITTGNQTKVAWITLSPYSDGCKKVFMIVKDGATIDKHKYSFVSDFNRMSGIEFSDNENVLYFSADHTSNKGIYSLNLTSGIKTFITGSGDYGRTALQTAPDGLIYAISNNGQYWGRLTPSGSFTASVLNEKVWTGLELSGNIYYSLPEDKGVFQPLSITLNLTAYVSCPDGNDGELTASVIGGTLPYTYAWYRWDGLTWIPMPQFTGPQATGLAEGDYKCCVTDEYVTVCEEMEVTIDPNRFTHNEIWNTYGTVSLNNENRSFLLGITVNPYSTLTLTNCTFQFAKGAKIIVKQGGKLVLDHSTLTHFEECGEMWLGVEVWGNKAYSQSATAYQGWVLMQNGSSIKNAMVGVYLAKRTGSTYDKNSTGGFIEVPNNGNPFQPAANFINNMYSIVFYPYKNLTGGMETYNRSNMRNCLFEVNENYLGGSWYHSLIYANGVNGVKFYGCTFTNNYSDLATGYGIYGLASGFIVEPICNSTTVPCPENSLDKCEFNRLVAGINISNSGTYTLLTKNTLFNNNSTGIRLTNVNYATVLFSNFEIGKASTFEEGECEETASGFGIDMTSCHGFAIEENSFTTEQVTGIMTGIRIAESQSTDQVYKNTFDGLSYGNYAVGKNWFLNYTSRGLAYYCNENTNNWQDFYVDTLTTLPSGIQNPIGGISLPAGNTFSPTANMHINNKGNYHIGYFYYEPTNGDTNTVFFPNTDKVWKVTREGVYLYENECLSHYGGGGGGGTGRGLVLTPGEKQETEQEYYENLADYNNVKALYDYLKDGGNTQLTISEVETAFPNDMWELRAGLLEKSPHLTTDVLKKTADRTDVFPDNVIFEIMAANPDELRKGELIKYLAEKENPLPEYMLTVLRQILETGITYKTILIGNMAHYNQVKTRAAYDIIRSILNDTVTDVDELRTWLGRLGGKRADEQIIASYMEEENHTQALSLANALPQAYDYDENELIEHGYYMDMLNLMNTLNQQGRTVFELDSTEVTNLVYIAENTKGTASAQAKGILEYAYGYHFCDCINADSTGYKSSGSFNPGNYGHAYGISITAGPNPATDWVAFDYSLNNDNATGHIKITDVAGKPVTTLPVTGRQGQKIWDTRQVNPGVYFYNFNASGVNKSGKIVVCK